MRRKALAKRFSFDSDRMSYAGFLFPVTAAYVILVFLFGGASRADVTSLLLLRPLSFVVLGFALVGLTAQHFRSNKTLLTLTALTVLLVAAQLVSLPPEVWQSLQGREIVMEVDAVVGMEGVWRPLSMTPGATWNALYSLAAPVALVLLGIQLSKAQLFKLLEILLLLAVLSGALGVIQIVGSAEGPAYFYRITTNGAAVGLFANRNHSAFFIACAFPLLCLFASKNAYSERIRNLRNGIVVAGAAFFLPLLLVTGSRAGLGALAIGLATIPFVYTKPELSTPKKRRLRKLNLRWVVGGAAAVSLVGVMLILSRAEAITRLLDGGLAAELRFSAASTIVDMIEAVFPFGSGMGSFPELYKVYEPDALLSPRYLNHAHNDWLELALTGGLPALMLLAIAAVVGLYAAWVAFVQKSKQSERVRFARSGIAIIAILAATSFFDYPLRVPSLMCLFAIACLWINQLFSTTSRTADKPFVG